MKKIEEQAKNIMDKFLNALNDIGEVDSNNIGATREQSVREEDAPKSCPNEEFRIRLFANAPSVEDEQLKMEKKHW